MSFFKAYWRWWGAFNVYTLYVYGTRTSIALEAPTDQTLVEFPKAHHLLWTFQP